MEEKYNDLEKRLVVLEKIEKRRRIMKGISIGFKLLIIIVVGVFVYKAYSTIQEYKQKLADIEKIQEKLEDTEKYIQEQIDKVKDLNPFK